MNVPSDFRFIAPVVGYFEGVPKAGINISALGGLVYERNC